MLKSACVVVAYDGVVEYCELVVVGMLVVVDSLVDGTSVVVLDRREVGLVLFSMVMLPFSNLA
jgi:hypothetical protein